MDRFGCLLGSLWVALGCLWVLLGRLRVPLGAPGGVGGHFGPPWGGHVAETPSCRQKKAFAIPSPDPADPGDPPDLVHGLQLGTSPTRAGGLDFVVFYKLPQIVISPHHMGSS